MINSLDKIIVSQVMDWYNHCERMTLKFYGFTTETDWMQGMYHITWRTLAIGACFGIKVLIISCLTLPKKLNY